MSSAEGREGKDSCIEDEDESSGILKHKSTVIYCLDKATKIQLPNNKSYDTQSASIKKITFQQYNLQELGYNQTTLGKSSKNNFILYLPTFFKPISLPNQFPFIILLKNISYLFLERGKEGEREEEKH